MALNNPSLSNHPLMRYRNTAHRHNHNRLCERKDQQGITLEELSKMDGFNELTKAELEEALKFIQVMTELLHSLNIK